MKKFIVFNEIVFLFSFQTLPDDSIPGYTCLLRLKKGLVPAIYAVIQEHPSSEVCFPIVLKN